MPDPRLAAGVREERRVEQWDHRSFEGFGRSIWLDAENRVQETVSSCWDVALDRVGSEFTRDGTDEVARELGSSHDPLVLREHIYCAFDDSRKMQGEPTAGFDAPKTLGFRDPLVGQARQLAFVGPLSTVLVRCRQSRHEPEVPDQVVDQRR